jgi:DNA processing protein
MGKFHYNAKNGKITTKLTKEELVMWFKLSQVKGFGPQKIRKLMSFFGNVGAVFRASNTELLQTRVFNEETTVEFEKLKSASDENFLRVIEECEESDVQIATLLDVFYPKNLTFVQSPPLTLFLLGDVELLDEKKIAIVGTRTPGTKATEYAHNLSKYAAQNGYVVVSGGATGIDTAAHRGAMDAASGKTIAVLGSGFNHPYPPENTGLFKEIGSRGLLISEYLPNFRGSKISYLQRNRITSGISDALFLVASGEKGGSATQVSIAHAQRKPIFCPKLELGILPNEGAKEAIKNFNAIQVEGPEQLLKMLNNQAGALFL